MPTIPPNQNHSLAIAQARFGSSIPAEPLVTATWAVGSNASLLRTEWSRVGLWPLMSLVFSVAMAVSFSVGGVQAQESAKPQIELKPLTAPQGLTPPEQLPPTETADLQFTEKLGQTIPLDLDFVDQDGRRLLLRELFNQGRPVILTFNYSACPRLCHIQLEKFADALRELTWSAGQEFDIVTITLDPLETSARLRATKNRHMTGYRRPEAARGWHFLVGSQANIRAVADAVGFPFKYDKKLREYIHPATLIFLTADAKVAHYRHKALEITTGDLKLTLTETAGGRIGSPLEQGFLNDLLLWCFHYDPLRNRYSWHAMRLMQAGGAVTLLGVIIGLGLLWRWEARRLAGTATPTTEQAPTAPPKPDAVS